MAQPKQTKNNAPFLIIGLVGLAAIIGALLYFQSARQTNAARSGSANTSGTTSAVSALERYQKAPAGAQPAWARGAANAPVTLEEFSDFECPSCAMFQPVMREIKTMYGDRVRVVARNYPLPMHPKAYDASRAAEAAGAQGKFWEMHDLLFAKQKEWKTLPDHRGEYAKYAESLGLNVAKFEADLLSDVSNTRVSADKQRGDALMVRSTPTVYLNGRPLLPEEMTIARMRALIDQTLQKQ